MSALPRRPVASALAAISIETTTFRPQPVSGMNVFSHVGKALVFFLAALSASGACSDVSPTMREILLRRYFDLNCSPYAYRSEDFNPVMDDALHSVIQDEPAGHPEQVAVNRTGAARLAYSRASETAKSEYWAALAHAIESQDIPRAERLLRIVVWDHSSDTDAFLDRYLNSPHEKIRDFALKWIQPSNVARLKVICQSSQSVIVQKLSATICSSDKPLSSDALPLLKDLTLNPDQNVASAALRALGAIPGGVEVLADCLPKLKGKLADACLYTLAYSNHDRAREFVLAATGSADDELRWRALLLSAEYKGPDFAVAISRSLRSANRFDRGVAMQAVGLLPEAEKREALWAGLHDESAYVRGWSCWVSSKQLGRLESAAWLVPMLSDRDGMVAGVAAGALSLSTPAVYLRSNATADEVAAAREWRGIVSMVDWRVVRRRLRDKDWRVRVQFAQLVAAWFPHQAEEIPLDFWHIYMGSPYMQSYSTGQIVKEIVASRSLEDLKKAPPGLRRTIAEMLLRNELVPPVPNLLKALWSDPDPFVHCAFFNYIRPDSSGNNLPWVDDYLKDLGSLPAKSRRQAVAAAGFNLGEPFLRTLLQDPDWEVRHLAADSLKKLFWSDDYLYRKRAREKQDEQPTRTEDDPR
jgi:HEAT repeat protein